MKSGLWQNLPQPFYLSSFDNKTGGKI